MQDSQTQSWYHANAEYPAFIYLNNMIFFFKKSKVKNIYIQNPPHYAQDVP